MPSCMDANFESKYLLAGEEQDYEDTGDRKRNQGILRDPEKDKEKSFWTSTSRRQKLTVLFAAISTSSIYFCTSIPGTFLARVSVSRGGDSIYAAAIINSSYFLASLASLICGYFQQSIPTKKFIWMGLLGVALSQGCLTSLDYLDHYALLAVGVSVKSVQGLGQGFFSVALLTLLWQELPDHIGKAFGMIGVMTSSGFILGPIIGGSLYSIRDSVSIPFIASAVPPLLLSVVGWMFLPDDIEKRDDSDCRTWYYIFNPKSVLVLGVASACSGAFAVYDASFTTYAQKMGISIVLVGWIMSVGDTFVAMACTAVGYLSDMKHVYREILMSICFIGLLAINFAFASSLQLLPLFVVVVVFTTCAATVQNFGFLEMIHQAAGDNENLKSNFAFRSRLSGVWYFFMTLSMVVFGLVGTALQSIFPYHMSQAITITIAIAITGVIAGIIFLYRSTTSGN